MSAVEQKIFLGLNDSAAVNRYFQEMGVRCAFVVCGRSAQRLEVGKYFLDLERRSGIEVVFFSDFTPNPSYESAVKATDLFRTKKCDCIVGLGGGSAIDVAKCVKLWSGSHAPLLAIPTTAGTGSEATHFAVVYHNGEKQSVANETCLPDAVWLDPSALETLPEYHRKASMLDAFCHGIESFWSVRATKESRGYACQAIQGILANWEDYLQNLPAGNTGMQKAAFWAGQAINITQTTAGHAMCYKLTTLYGIAHGHAAALCNAALWPFMVDQAESTMLIEAFQSLAETMGCGTPQQAIDKYINRLNSLQLETPVPSPEDFAVLQASVNQERLANNPIPLAPETIRRLYHQILGGELA